MSKSSILKVEKFYNICLHKIAKINLLNINIYDQFQALERFKLLPFTMRLLYRSSIFCYKILNNQILPLYLNESNSNGSSKFWDREIIYVPFERTSAGCLRLSIWLPPFINKVLKFSFRLYWHHLKRFLINNLKNLFNKFWKIYFMNIFMYSYFRLKLKKKFLLFFL